MVFRWIRIALVFLLVSPGQAGTFSPPARLSPRVLGLMSEQALSAPLVGAQHLSRSLGVRHAGAELVRAATSVLGMGKTVSVAMGLYVAIPVVQETLLTGAAYAWGGIPGLVMARALYFASHSSPLRDAVMTWAQRRRDRRFGATFIRLLEAQNCAEGKPHAQQLRALLARGISAERLINTLGEGLVLMNQMPENPSAAMATIVLSTILAEYITAETQRLGRTPDFAWDIRDQLAQACAYPNGFLAPLISLIGQFVRDSPQTGLFPPAVLQRLQWARMFRMFPLLTHPKSLAAFGARIVGYVPAYAVQNASVPTLDPLQMGFLPGGRLRLDYDDAVLRRRHIVLDAAPDFLRFHNYWRVESAFGLADLIPLGQDDAASYFMVLGSAIVLQVADPQAQQAAERSEEEAVYLADQLRVHPAQGPQRIVQTLEKIKDHHLQVLTAVHFLSHLDRALTSQEWNAIRIVLGNLACLIGDQSLIDVITSVENGHVSAYASEPMAEFIPLDSSQRIPGAWPYAITHAGYEFLAAQWHVRWAPVVIDSFLIELAHDGASRATEASVMDGSSVRRQSSETDRRIRMFVTELMGANGLVHALTEGSADQLLRSVLRTDRPPKSPARPPMEWQVLWRWVGLYALACLPFIVLFYANQWTLELPGYSVLAQWLSACDVELAVSHDLYVAARLWLGTVYLRVTASVVRGLAQSLYRQHLAMAA